MDGEITFLQYVGDEANGTSYTFSSQNLGTAAADRYILVCLSGNSGGSGRQASSVTVGGVSATALINSTAAERYESIWLAAVPTGTTGDVVATFSGTGVTRAGISMYRITGLTTTTPTDTIDNASQPATGTIDVTAGGCVVGLCKNATNDACTWTGITEDFDDWIGDINETAYSTAHETFTSAQSGTTVTAAWGSYNSTHLVAVSLELDYTAPATDNALSMSNF